MTIHQCRFGDGEAIAVFDLPGGCTCYPDDRQQSLCLHHSVRAQPLGGMELVEDFTVDGAFRRAWEQGKI